MDKGIKYQKTYQFVYDPSQPNPQIDPIEVKDSDLETKNLLQYLKDKLSRISLIPKTRM